MSCLAPLRLGTRDRQSFLNGRLAEVAIYPRVLTAEEVRENHMIATAIENSNSGEAYARIDAARL
jgi:hypothetical protein